MSETVDQLVAAVAQLNVSEKQQFILQALPGLGQEAVKDPAFLPQLLPIMLGLIRESGLDLGQLVQFAQMFAAGQPAGND